MASTDPSIGWFSPDSKRTPLISKRMFLMGDFFQLESMMGEVLNLTLFYLFTVLNYAVGLPRKCQQNQLISLFGASSPSSKLAVGRTAICGG